MSDYHVPNGGKPMVRLGGLMQDYRSWAKIHRSNRTVVNLNWALSKVLQVADACQGIPLTAEGVRELQANLVHEGLAPNSVNSMLNHLSGLVTWAIKTKRYDGTNPFHVDRLPVIERQPRFMTKDDIAALLASARAVSPDILRFCGLGIYAGLRKGEIIAARWEWVDEARHLITVRCSNGFQTKSKRERSVPLHPALAEILTPVETEDYICWPDKQGQGRDYRLDPRYGFDLARHAAVLEWVTPHTLRHTFASQCAMAGRSLYEIQTWLGHRDPKTTMIYAHLQPGHGEIDW